MDNSTPIVDDEIKGEFIESLGQEKYDTYNKMYYEKLDNELNILLKLYESKEFLQLKKIAHSLKGLSFNLGYMLIGNYFSEIEKLSKLEKDFSIDHINNVFDTYQKMKTKFN
jgi:hypothetical protein